MNELHIHPVDDLIEHAIADDCVCGPSLRPVKRADGSTGWLYVHSSLDAREIAEQHTASARRGPNL